MEEILDRLVLAYSVEKLAIKFASWSAKIKGN
jgi:hypothetical protein